MTTLFFIDSVKQTCSVVCNLPVPMLVPAFTSAKLKAWLKRCYTKHLMLLLCLHVDSYLNLINIHVFICLLELFHTNFHCIHLKSRIIILNHLNVSMQNHSYAAKYKHNQQSTPRRKCFVAYLRTWSLSMGDQNDTAKFYAGLLSDLLQSLQSIQCVFSVCANYSDMLLWLCLL